jgi:ABC-type transport system involved in Fe-S cluster assembly fused permease/ATPase subunit
MLVEEKKKKIREILEGKGSDYENQAQDLQSKALQIQEERLLLGRKMKELKQAKVEREAMFQKLEDEINITKKERLVWRQILTDHHFVAD